jgi:hypothetical protein
VQAPPHVSYVVNTSKDFAAEGVVADHAYWLGGLTLRDSAASPWGNVDVRSEAFCVGDAPASATQFGAGVAGSAYTREYKTWGDAPGAPCADTLDITATNVSRIVVDAAQARVDCNAKVNLSADGPVDVEIVNATPSPCGGVLQPAGLGGGTLATSAGLAALPDTAASIAAPVALPAGTALLGALALGRRRRRSGARRSG